VARIAIVDDDRDFLALVADILEQDGHEPLTYDHGDGIVAQLREVQPDLIVLDVRMEDTGSGWQVLHELRKDRATATIPLIVCSADRLQLAEREARLWGHGVAILPKPFDLDVFDALIDQLLTDSPAARSG
jgi:DNA-binding response OmpR family regulator